MEEKKKNENKVDTSRVAEALLIKMIRYEAQLDKKPELSKPEKRRIELLRSFRSVGMF